MKEKQYLADFFFITSCQPQNIIYLFYTANLTITSSLTKTWSVKQPVEVFLCYGSALPVCIFTLCHRLTGDFCQQRQKQAMNAFRKEVLPFRHEIFWKFFNDFRSCCLKVCTQRSTQVTADRSKGLYLCGRKNFWVFTGCLQIMKLNQSFS